MTFKGVQAGHWASILTWYIYLVSTGGLMLKIKISSKLLIITCEAVTLELIE